MSLRIAEAWFLSAAALVCTALAELSALNERAFIVYSKL